MLSLRVAGSGVRHSLMLGRGNGIIKPLVKGMKCLIVIEHTATGFSAYSPDIDGCVASGWTREEVARAMSEAVEFHLDGLRQERMALPQPYTESMYLQVG